MPDTTWMLYGATGYTGKLLAAEAVRRGHKPLLAGRSAEKLRAVAEPLGLPSVAVDLGDAAGLRRALDGLALCLHAAGPFVQTSAPMVRACLDAGASYLDITGEIPVFEASFCHDAKARARGVAIISGVGFDVVPTDCLAAHVAAQLPGATRLELGIDSSSTPSGGTVKSVLELLPKGGVVRREGRLQPWPLGTGAALVRFEKTTRECIPIPWGDLSTAFRTTHIPDITVYMAMPSSQITAVHLGAPFFLNALKIGPLRRAIAGWAERRFPGPDAEERARGRSSLWARVQDREGRSVEAWMETPDGYAFTALSGVRAVERTLEKKPVGATTPALAFGADFILELDGVRRLDSLPAGRA